MAIAKLTFSIPIFHSNEVYLKKAIESVLRQSDPNWHLLIIDGNYNRDKNTQQYIKTLNDQRISYVRNNSDLSMAGNWNFAFQAASTDLVTLLHDDDILEITYAEKMLEIAKKYPNSSVFYTGVHLIDRMGRRTCTIADSVKAFLSFPYSGSIKHLSGDKGLNALLKGCFIFCPTVCYRKSKLPNNPFNKEWKMVTDFQFYFETLITGGTITGISTKLYKYRRHNQNQTVRLTASLERFREEVNFYRFVAKKVRGKWSSSENTANKKNIIKMHLAYLLLKSVLSGRFHYAKSLVRFYKDELK